MNGMDKHGTNMKEKRFPKKNERTRKTGRRGALNLLVVHISTLGLFGAHDILQTRKNNNIIAMFKRFKRMVASMTSIALLLLVVQTGVANGVPATVSGATFDNPAKGRFVFFGDFVEMTVQATSGLTLNADFSRLHGNPEGSNFVLGVDNSDDTYSVLYPISFTNQAIAHPEIILYSGATEIDRLDHPEQMTIIANLDQRSNKPAYCQGGTDESTDFSKVTDFRSVQLVLHCPGKGKITFKNNLDLTDSQMLEFLSNLASMLDADTTGDIGLSANVISYMAQQGAYITAYNLPYESIPDIKYVDNSGAEHNPFTDGTVKNFTYDASTGTASFEVSHFSTFKTVPKVELSEPSNNAASNAKKIMVKGTVSDNDATVKIYVNNAEQESVTVNANGSFEKEVTLTQASNTIKVTSSNSIGSGYDVERTVTKNAPAIMINDPAENATVSTKTPLLKGSVTDPYATVRVYVNDVDQGDVTVGANGSFEKQITLANKTSTVRVTALDGIHTLQEKSITLTNNTLPATGMAGWQWVLAALSVLFVSGLGLFLMGCKKKVNAQA